MAEDDETSPPGVVPADSKLADNAGLSQYAAPSWADPGPEDFVEPEAGPNYFSEDVPVYESVGSLEDCTHIGVTLAQLLEYLAIHSGLKKSLATLPLTILLWGTYMTMAFYHCQAQSSFNSADHVRRALENSYYTPEGPNGPEVRIHDIVDYRGIVPWIDNALVPALKEPGEMQILIGFARVRQTRGENATQCPELSEDMQSVYGSGCFPPGGFVGPYGPERAKFELAEAAFQPVAENQFEMWLEVNRSRSVVSERIRKLEYEGWIDLSTQSVEIEGLFVNVEAHIYTHFSILLTLHREGWVEPYLLVTPLRGEVYSHWSQVFLDAIWLLLFLALALETVLGLTGSSDPRVLTMHLFDPFTWIDVSLVMVGGSIVGIFYFFVYWLNKFTEEVFALGVMPPFSMAEAPPERKVQASIENTAYTDQMATLFDWFSWFIMMTGWYRLCSFLYVLITIGRFARGFIGQPRVAVLVQVILTSVNFICHYFLLLAIVFSTFCVGGYVLFGEDLAGWSTPGRTLGKMLLVLFMRFDYKEFHSVAPLSAALWFSAFFVLVSVLLVKLLTAAIMFKYAQIRERLGEPGKSIIGQVKQWLQDMKWGRTYDGAKRTLLYEDLLRLLAADVDPIHLRNLGRLQGERRLRTRADLHQAETSPTISAEFLVERGCDPHTAQRLLHEVAEWTHGISSTSSPVRRLMILVARQITFLRKETENMAKNVRKRFDSCAKVVDRTDLKHAKSLALARRLSKAQELPPGWTAHADAEGRRYLRQEETGLTSWTLPKHML